MLHPPMTHFAVALPIISLILGLAYLYKPTEIMSKISTRFMIFASIFMIAAFFTGKSDGSDAYILLSGDGQTLLKEHKNLGLYVLISMLVITAIKLFGCYKKVFKAEMISIVLLSVVAGTTLYQGKMGGDITYKYGANVEQYAEGMECIDDPEEFLEND